MKFHARLCSSFATFGAALLCSATTAFAQGGPVQVPGSAPSASGAPQWMNLALLGGMVLFMWFFLIRPQSKRQKEHKLFVDSLTAGQEVVTQGGIIGRITSVADQIVTLDVGCGSIRVLKSAVSYQLNAPAGGVAKS